MNDKIKIFMEDAVLVKNKAYFFSRYWNALYAADLVLKKVEFVSTMPEENILADRLSSGITYYNGKLILVPMTAKKIWIYDLNQGSWQGIERKYVTDKGHHMEMFRAVKYKKDLFLIGSNYPAIIRMDVDNCKLEYLEEPYSFFACVKDKTDSYFRADFSLVDNQLFLASCLNHFVLRLNLDTFDFTWFEVGESSFRYSGIAWDGKYYWLSPRGGNPIVKWDGKSNTEYFPLPKGFIHDKYNFLGVQYNDGKMIFPGMLQDYTLEINIEYPYKMEVQKGRYTFYRYSDMEGRLFQTADGLFQWERSGKNRSGQMYCELLSVDLAKYFRTQIEKIKHLEFKNKILTEFPFALPCYVSIIEQRSEIENEKTKIGEIIWKIIQS